MNCTPRPLTPEGESQDSLDRFHAYWEGQWLADLELLKEHHALLVAQEEEEKALDRLERWTARLEKHADRLERRTKLFFHQVHFNDSGCLIWSGVTTTQGYGVFSVSRGTTTSAHRFLYIAVMGSVADEMELHHVCRNHSCVLPDHLTPVPRSEHTKLEIELRTHCRRGHIYTEKDRKKDGTHLCKTCVKESEWRRAQKRASNALDV